MWARAGICQLDVEGGEAFGGLWNLSYVDPLFLFAEFGGGVGSADGIEAEVASFGIRGLPEVDFGGLILNVDDDGPVLHLPGKARTWSVGDDCLIKRQQTIGSVAAFEVVLNVRDIADVFFLGKRGVVEVRIVRKEVLVSGGVDEELRHLHLRAVAVVIGIFNVEDGFVFGRSNFRGEDSLTNVVVQRSGEEAVGFEVVFGDDFAVEGVDDHGNDGDDAPVDSSDKPGGPAALGTSSDDEIIDLYFGAGSSNEELLNGIHGADSTFDHGKTDKPSVVFGGEVFEAGVRDKVVFRPAFVGSIGEEQGLIRDHAEVGDDGVGFGGDAHRAGVGLRRSGVAVLAAADEQESFVGCNFVRASDGEPMFPNRAVDVFFGAPGLRSEFEDVGADALSGNGLDQLPTVDGIFGGDVAVECGFLLGEKGDAGK